MIEQSELLMNSRRGLGEALADCHHFRTLPARLDFKEYGLNLAIHADYVVAVYAASVLDGHTMAVEHWEGEVSR